jgi:hypothetical protein
MPIDQAGWFSWMIRDPGPPHKVNGGRNGGKGKVPHSAEGYWPYLRDGVLWGPRRASWGASNLKDGRCFQHYSIWEQTWTSGAPYPNNNFFTTENEGVTGEPLTPAQTANLTRIITELSALQGWEPRRPSSKADKLASLYEHNECVRFGAEPTSCPSGRIPWDKILAGLQPPAQEEEDVKPYLVWAPDRAALYLVGPLGARRIISPAVGDQLAKDLGPVKVAYSGATLDAMNVPPGA